MQLLHSSLKPAYDPQAPENAYPKWVHFDDKRPSVLVESAEEEAALASGDDGADDFTAEGPQAEREALIAQAEKQGIKIDRRWSIEKLRGALA